MNNEKKHDDPRAEDPKPGKALSEDEMKETAAGGSDPVLRKRPGRPSKEKDVLTEEELKRAAGGATDRNSTRSNKGKCKE